MADDTREPKGLNRPEFFAGASMAGVAVAAVGTAGTQTAPTA
jgi:hypothetical protein